MNSFTSSQLPAIFSLRIAVANAVASGAASEDLVDAYHASVTHSDRDGINAMFLAQRVATLPSQTLPDDVQVALTAVRNA